MKTPQSLFLTFETSGNEFCRAYKGTKASNVSTFPWFRFSYALNSFGHYAIYANEEEQIGAAATAGELTGVVLRYLRGKGWTLNLF